MRSRPVRFALGVHLAFLLVFSPLQEVRANEDLNEAVEHTERVNDAYYEGLLLVAAAAKKVNDNKKIFEFAKAAYEGALATAQGRAALFAAMTNADAAVLAAEFALTKAKQALPPLAAAAAGFWAGTGIYQLGSVGWDACFDPLCTLSSVQPDTEFEPATRAEIEAALPSLVVRLTGYEYAEFVYTDSARVAWEYMTLAGRFYVDVARGAAASNSGDFEGLFEAADSMDAELLAIPPLMQRVANLLDMERVLPEFIDTGAGCNVALLQALDEGVDALDFVLARAQEEAEADDSCRVENGGAGCDTNAVVASAAAMRDALQSTRDELSITQLHDPQGVPRLWGDIIRKGTRADMQAFVAAVQADGIAAIPPWEIYAADTLLSIAGVHVPGVGSMGPAIAAYDAAADGREEAAIFDGQPDSVPLSRVLRVSATTLSQTGRWLNYKMEDSPVWVAVPDAKPQSGNRILGVRPNPASSGLPARLLLTVSTASTVNVGLFDVAGRRVGSLTTQAEHPGPLMLSLDDATIGRLASGIYLIRMLVDGVPADRGKVLFVAP